MTFPQIFDMVNLGIAVLDKELKVCKWNRWLEMHTRVAAEDIIDSPLIDHFPNLNKNWFLKNCRAVLRFGNFAFFSQKLHQYILPIKPVHHFDPDFEYMQQNCTLGPLYNDNKEITHIYMIIQDATEVAAYEVKLVDMSTRDGLTEVYNRRFFESKLKYELERHKRYNRPLSLVMIDIDYFKQVNDEFGHQAGDQVLVRMSALLTGRLRMVDTVARYGGEEFCIILPETNREAAAIVADQLRKLVEATEFTSDDATMEITISVGVIEADETDSDTERLLKKVDDALYKAKDGGRNNVVTL